MTLWAGFSMSKIEERQAKDRAQAVKYIENFKNRDDLVDYSKRLKKSYPHLKDLSDLCLDLCVEKKYANGNIYKLPEPKPEDNEKVDLQSCWQRAAVITNILNLQTLNSVKKKGYLVAMLDQIKDINDIGHKGYIRLKSFNALEYSAEYLMRKYYSDKLTNIQIEMIDQILDRDDIAI